MAATPGGVGTIHRAVHQIICNCLQIDAAGGAADNVALFSPGRAGRKGFLQYSFAGGVDGAYPESDLIMDAAGNLYGQPTRAARSGAARSLNSLAPTMAGSIKSSTASLMALMMVVAQRRAWFLTVQGTSTGLPHSGVAPIAMGASVERFLSSR